MVDEKVRKTLDKLDKNGVVYLEYLGYSTNEEDEEQSEKYQDEYETLLEAVVSKMEKDLDKSWSEIWLTLEYFGNDNDGNGWYVKLRDDNNDYYFGLTDVLTGTDYVEKIEL